MQITLENIELLAWDKMADLLPAIIQHQDTGAVLMQGYMNREALAASLKTGKATFFSRSKQRLWVKGEVSGHYLNLDNVISDCDHDSLLITCRPQGPTCHLGTDSCFVEQDIHQKNFLGHLEQIIASRRDDDPKDSYTASLFAKGTTKIAQKVGEEGVEVALAAVAETREELLGECADLLYHTLVLLQDKNIDLSEVMEVLARRHNKQNG